MDVKKREADENDSPVSFSRLSSGAASMWNGQAGGKRVTTQTFLLSSSYLFLLFSGNNNNNVSIHHGD